MVSLSLGTFVVCTLPVVEPYWTVKRRRATGAFMATTFEIPATLSNLGPGFDVLGLALTLTNQFTVTITPGRWTDGGKDVDPDSHLVHRTARRAASHFGGGLSGLSVHQVERVPRSRGLGSSATARVAGALAYASVAETRPSLEEVAAFLCEEEGHPDNALAALLGGLTLGMRTPSDMVMRSVTPPAALSVALCIPDVEVSTDKARAILPVAIERSDAVANGQHLALLMHGLLTGDRETLRHGLIDYLHQPWRGPLIGPVDEVFEAARSAGAVGAFISGSGSTLAAFCDPQSVNIVACRMRDALAAHGMTATALTSEPSTIGGWSQLSR